MSDPFLPILGLILLVTLVQLWSVQRVEARYKKAAPVIDRHSEALTELAKASLFNEQVHQTIGLALHRIDLLLKEKGISSELILSDLLVDEMPKIEETGVLPPV